MPLNHPNEKLSSRLPSRKSIPPFESLRAFDAVARLGGIRKAAHGLLRDHAVVSRHLKAVEDWVGCQLLDRTPTGVVLTEEGRLYHQQISEAINQISEATIAMMKHSSDQSLQVWCMSGFAVHWMASHLRSFELSHPSVNLELRSTGEQPDFNRHEADVNIRIFKADDKRESLAPGLRSQRIARPAIIPVASPEYLKRCGHISKPLDLLDCYLLHEDDVDVWQSWFGEHKVDNAEELRGVKLWDGHMTLAAARHGRGVALTNNLVAVNDLAQGSLVHIGKDNPSFLSVYMGSYHFVARADRWGSPSVRKFRRWLMTNIADEFRL